MLITLNEALKKFGPILNGVWANESLHCSRLELPKGIPEYLKNTATGKPTKAIYCNNYIKGPLLEAFYNILDSGLQHQLVSFDGCFNIRDVRGLPGRVSSHAYALAIDINAKSNKLNTYGEISEELALCFTDVGFVHGRTFSRLDPMHFTLGW